ncbi:AI-2E family transporter [Candidatus Falkowbacteria bacterium]|nr:AI-2E family transporter [Candidatus Falkowbacteria bacterium]
MATQNKKVVDISIFSFLKIIGVVLALLFLYIIRDILAIVFVAVILGSAIDPWVDYLQNKKIPRAVSILSLYVVGLGIFAVILVLIVPVMTTELTGLANNFPIYYEKVLNSFGQFQGDSAATQSLSTILESWAVNLGQTTKGVFSTLSGIFGGIISFLAVLVITFYLIVHKDNMKNFIQTVTPPTYQAYAIQLYNRVQKKIGSWLSGQISLMIIIAVFSYIGLLVLGVKYTLLLALIAGLTEIIPYVGPIIGAAPAVLIAFTQSPLKGLLVIILYIIIQQLENSVIVPKVMKKAVGLNPIVVIVAILIGGKVAGVLGALLAVPIATILSVLLTDFFEITKSQET